MSTKKSGPRKCIFLSCWFWINFGKLKFLTYSAQGAILCMFSSLKAINSIVTRDRRRHYAAELTWKVFVRFVNFTHACSSLQDGPFASHIPLCSWHAFYSDSSHMYPVCIAYLVWLYKLNSLFSSARYERMITFCKPGRTAFRIRHNLCQDTLLELSHLCAYLLTTPWIRISVSGGDTTQRRVVGSIVHELICTTMIKIYFILIP
jgi:hypothetical protein